MDKKIDIYGRKIEPRLNSLKEWKVPEPTKDELLRFLSDLELGKVNRGKRIGEARRMKYIDQLKVSLEFWNKPTEDINTSDVESFERALASGAIVGKRTGRPYMAATRSDLKKILRVFLRWRLGREKALALTEWLDIRVPRKTPDYLKESDIEALFKRCRTIEQRFVVAVLFDSGARAEEFHNIRYEDIHLPEGKENYVKLTLKEEYSKTKGRVIALYWKHSLDAVRDFLQERIRQGIKPRDPVYDKKYDASRQWLHRLGKEALGRAIHYHLFRHSSATFYASKLNRQELCYRYGWTFSSNMPDVYISRAGMVSKELDERFTNTEVGELKLMIEKMEAENRILRESMAREQEQIASAMREMSEYREFMGMAATGIKSTTSKSRAASCYGMKFDDS
jgi:site-specific recombinase XerD